MRWTHEYVCFASAHRSNFRFNCAILFYLLFFLSSVLLLKNWFAYFFTFLPFITDIKTIKGEPYHQCKALVKSNILSITRNDITQQHFSDFKLPLKLLLLIFSSSTFFSSTSDRNHGCLATKLFYSKIF